MAESTLSLTIDDLRGEVGLFLGWGRGTPSGDEAWTSAKAAAINSCVKSGLRQFYYPPPVEGQENAYDWSFLRPTATFTIPTATSSLALPDDFGGIEGDIAVSSSGTSMFRPLAVYGEGTVRQRFSELPNTTGRPQMAALCPVKGTGMDHGTRHTLLVWPTSDAAYTLSLRYYVNANYLDSGFPYHMGGTQHAETVLESCLAIAEQRLDDTSAVHSAKFMQRLLASISADRKLKPQKLGYNGDNSDLRNRLGWRHPLDSGVTYMGVQY